MPAVISRSAPTEVTLYGPEPDEEKKKLAWRAVLRSWYRTHPEEARREEPKQIRPGA